MSDQCGSLVYKSGWILSLMCHDDRIAVKYCDSSREAFTVMYNQFTCANLVFSLVAQGTNKPFSVVLFDISCTMTHLSLIKKGWGI